MPFKYTQSQFLDKCTIKHDGLYDYSESKFNGSNNKIHINCRKHGGFELRAKDHLQGRGCRVCAMEKMGRSKSKGAAKFIEEAQKVHGEKFDYSQVNYTNNYTKVRIVCQVHGPFMQTPYCHLKGGEVCPVCRTALSDSVSVNEILTDKYAGTITLTDRRTLNSTDRFEFDCTYHGKFHRKVSLTVDTGCISCNRESDRSRRTERLIQRAKEVHGDTYDYGKVIPTHDRDKVVITCKMHGDFRCLLHNHAKGSGCPICNRPQPIEREGFLSNAEEIHKGKYKYDKIPNEFHITNKLPITCRKHGLFNQRGDTHLKGSGCPSCSNHGFNPDITGYLYVIPDLTLEKVKIGITNNPERRIPAVIRPVNFECGNATVYKFEQQTIAVRSVENILHKILDNCGFSGFDGATEWCEIDGAEHLCAIFTLIESVGGIRT
ncbi:endonuclease [Vibrio phage K459]